jgi:hypothetical protein
MAPARVTLKPVVVKGAPLRGSAYLAGGKGIS